MRSRIFKLQLLRSHRLRKIVYDLRTFVTEIRETKQRIFKKYVIGMSIIFFSLLLISTANFLAFFPNSYDLNPILPIHRQINPFSISNFDAHFWEITRGYRLFRDSFKYQGRILAYQIVISATLARIYINDGNESLSNHFKQSYLAFLLILMSFALIAISNGKNAFPEGKITWLILFSTALGIFLLAKQIQKRDPLHV